MKGATVTQNPYQQGPPPQGGYPQQPPYGYPQGQPTGPAPAQQYPAQQWPPAGGVPQGVPEPGAPTPFTQPGQAGPPAGGNDPFGAPGVPTGGGGDQPGMHQLGGRLLLIRPSSYNPAAPAHPSSQNKTPSALVMAELIVCDGDPIPGNVNGDTEQFTPFAAGPKVAPFYCGSMFIRGAVLPGQLEAYVAGRGFCLGRMVKGTPGKSGKPPWVLADPTEDDKVIGRQIHAAWEQIKQASAPVQPRPDQFGPAQGGGQQPQYQPQPQPQPQPQYQPQPQPQYQPQPQPYPQQPQQPQQYPPY